MGAKQSEISAMSQKECPVIIERVRRLPNPAGDVLAMAGRLAEEMATRTMRDWCAETDCGECHIGQFRRGLIEVIDRTAHMAAARTSRFLEGALNSGDDEPAHELDQA